MGASGKLREQKYWMRQKPSTLPAHTYRRLSPEYLSLSPVKVLLSGGRARASRWVWHKTVLIALLRVQTSGPGKEDVNSSLSLYI